MYASSATRNDYTHDAAERIRLVRYHDRLLTELSTTFEGKCRLLDLTRGGRFTLLNFGVTAPLEALPSTVAILNVRQQVEAPEDLLDSEGHFFVPLVRPPPSSCSSGLTDIGLVSDTGVVSHVSDYLRKTA